MADTDARSFDWPMLVTLLLIGFVPAFSGALINPTIPAIQNAYSHLPNSETLAQLVSTMSAPIVVIVAPIVGVLLDRYKRKPVLVGALVVFGVGTSAAFFLDSLYAILATRILDGIAVATLGVTVPTLVADYYDGSRRESVMGWYSAVSMGGGAIAAIVGGVVADIQWRYIFPIYALALLLIPLIVRHLPEPTTKTPVDDDVGRLEAARKIIRDSPVVVLVGIYCLVAFAMLTNNLIQIELPYYLQGGLDVDGSLTGVTLSAAMAAAVVSSVLYGRIKSRFRHVSIVLLGLAVATVGYTLISTMEAFPFVFVGVLVGACGIGFMLPTANDWVASIVDEQYRGRALSGVTTMMYLGFALSPFAPTPLIGAFGRQGMFLVWSGFLLVATVGTAAIWWTSRSPRPTPAAEPSD